MPDRHVIRFLLACVAFAFVSTFTVGARATKGAHKNSRASATPTAILNQVFDLRDFGATGDGVTNDGPALQAALNALAQAGGGTLQIPAGRYAIITPVAKDFSGLASSVRISGVISDTPAPLPNVTGEELTRGLNLTSELLPRTGEEQIAVYLAGLQSLNINDLAFVGTPDVYSDASFTLYIRDVDSATVRHCEFYGLSSVYGAIVQAERSGLKVEQCVYLGCAANSGFYGSVVQNVDWKSVEVSGTVFTDYGQRPELYGKLDVAAPFSWVGIGNAAATTNASPRREAVFRNVFFDEGALSGISSDPGRYPASANIDLLYISGLHMNVSNLATSGLYLSGLQGALVEDAHFGWSHNADSAINILGGTQNAILERIRCTENVTRIRADETTARIAVIDSTCPELASLAGETQVVNVTTPDDDPVLYVRTQFSSVAGREPDAAEHFYWSDRILRCGVDSACVAEARAALASYLAAAPAPTFMLDGTASDENGQPLAGVAVTLSGSGSATTMTDAAGLYHFNALPRSGTYTVAVSKRHYTFAQPVQTVVNPAGDQIIDFAATLERHSISGQLMDNLGRALQGVTVILSGARSATTMTDADGNFSFDRLTAGGNYTVSPSSASHTFEPAAQTFEDLDGDRLAAFNGTLQFHSIAGNVKENGAGLNGVTVTLSGSQSGVLTTGAGGAYSFNVAAGDSYTITLSKAHYTFTPPARSFNNISADQTADFDASLNRHAISGRVIKTDGSGLQGATITLSGSQTSTAQTDANGNYAFASLPEGGDYTVLPSKKGYTFDRAAASFASLDGDRTADFNATAHGIIGFGAASYSVGEGDGSLNVTVTRDGDTSSEASVVYQAKGDTAKRGSDFVASIGLLTFAPGETSKGFSVFITDDSFVESPEQFTLTLAPQDSAILGDHPTAIVTINDNDTAPSSANPVDDAEFYVRQHYRDFLNREPDAAGLAFWVGGINQCGTNAQCREVKRVDVSAAFFLSIEFQETGYFVYRLYGAAYGRTPQRVEEFMLDSRVVGDGLIVGPEGWQQKLEANKAAFVKTFVARPEFSAAYPLTQTPAQFVAALNAHTGSSLKAEEAAAAAAEFGGAGNTSDIAARGRVLRLVAENRAFYDREFGPAFVLMQYFGYLRRAPEEPPDANLDGFNYWLKKLEDNGGDFHKAEMVKAFLSATEYRGRFGN